MGLTIDLTASQTRHGEGRLGTKIRTGSARFRWAGTPRGTNEPQPTMDTTSKLERKVLLLAASRSSRIMACLQPCVRGGRVR